MATDHRPWVLLLPHAALRFTRPALDSAFGALPPGLLDGPVRAAYLPNAHFAAAQRLRGRTFATFDAFQAAERTAGAQQQQQQAEHSVAWYRDELQRRVPGAEWAVVLPAESGETDVATARLLARCALVVVSADLSHTQDATLERTAAAWRSDSRAERFFLGLDAADDGREGAPPPVVVGSCALPNLRWVRRWCRSGRCEPGVVVDRYTSAGLVRHGPADRELPVAGQAGDYSVGYVAAVWPPPGADTAARGRLRDAGARAAGRLLRAACFATALLPPAASWPVPDWVDAQLLAAGVPVDCGAYVTLHRPAAPAAGVGVGAAKRRRRAADVWCCMGHHPWTPGARAAARPSTSALAAAAACRTDGRATGPVPLDPGLFDLSILWSPSHFGPPVPTADGPSFAEWTRRGAPTVAHGRLDAARTPPTFQGSVFLPSVWKERPACSWSALDAALRRKAGEPTGGRTFLVPTVTIRSRRPLPTTAPPDDGAACGL